MTTSLVSTLTRRLFAIGAVLTLLNLAGVGLYYGSDPEGLRRDKIDTEIDRLAESLRPSPGGWRFEPPASLRERFALHPQAYAFRIVDDRGRVLAQANTQLVPPLIWPLESRAEGPDAWWLRIEASQAGEPPLLIGHRKVTLGGETFGIGFAAARDPSHLLARVMADELLRHVVVPLVPFALLLTLVNVVTVGRSLRSLREAANAARRLDANRGIGLLPTAGLPAEVLALVSAVNSTLERLAFALQAERAFAAEAAHALRTPLAVLAARLEASPTEPEAQDRWRAALREDVAGMTRLVRQLLDVAQADALVVAEGTTCDLSDVAADVVARLAPMAYAQGRLLALEAPMPVPVHGDADALAHAARNLVENALRFAPAATEIVVTAGPGPRLSVRDHGPGFAATEGGPPGWRARASHDGGTGLGLRIVRRIMEAHGGALDIQDAPGGGTLVTLTLREAAPGTGTGHSKRPRPIPGTAMDNSAARA
jgi:two-component system OmpR family sensor kinase